MTGATERPLLAARTAATLSRSRSTAEIMAAWQSWPAKVGDQFVDSGMVASRPTARTCGST